MCGRYTLTVSLEELMFRYAIEETPVLWHTPKYNMAPGQMHPAVIHDGTRYRLGELKWGFVPSWSDDPKIGYSMINARAETAASKPAFRDSFMRKRCILPMDSFYEWQQTSQGKRPIRILLKNRSQFNVAGLYDTWTAPDGSKLSTFTILTTEPNEVVKPFHDRMPVILRQDDEAAWLDRNNHDLQQLQSLLQPYPAEEMEAYPVKPAVGNVKMDDASLIEPYEEDEQLELW